jgi:hypothetical protein
VSRFTAVSLDDLDEPVRRYFRHAIAEGAVLQRGVRLTMSGRVKVGVWLPFDAEERCDGTSFDWRARIGRLLVVVDGYADGAGSTEGRLFGRRRLFGSDDPDTVRSAAGRAALEAIWAPMCLLPERGVAWRAEASDLIVATWDVPPERPEVHIRIDDRGAVKSAWAQRWSPSGYRPCGCEVHAERRWGDLGVPGGLTVGWGFGSPDYAPFFHCELQTLTAENY